MSEPARTRSRAKSNGELFFWPLVIGLTSSAGLISALLGDGAWDAVSWGLLAIPVATCVFHSCVRR